jgi:tripartite-type tricarboxylate transporter receptor subunit TctC
MGMMKFSRLAILVGGMLATLGLVDRASAQTYPTRPITMVVAYAPGGPSDVAARAIIDRMSSVLGQPIIIENVAGAGGMTAAARVARAAPDGHTILIHQNGLAIGSLIYPQQSFDVQKDLVPIGMVNTSYSFLAVSKTVPANTLDELIAWTKKSGRPLKFAHPGVGTLAHLQAILFTKSFDVKADLVPYRGGAPAMNDVVAGHVDMVWAAPTTAAELIKGDKIKSVGFGANKRYAPLPEIPSFGELGHGDLAISFWHALFAPAGTPQPVIQQLNAALRQTLDDPQVMKAYEERGLEAFPQDQRSPEAAGAVLRAELDRWGTVVRENNIQVQ